MIDRASIKERAMSMFRMNYWPCVGLFALFMVITGAVSGFASIGGNIANLSQIGENSGYDGFYAVLTGISLVLSMVGIALIIFIHGPLAVSQAKASISVYDGGRPDFKHIFYGFSGGRYWKSVGGMALSVLFGVLAVFVVIIPLLIVFGLTMGFSMAAGNLQPDSGAAVGMVVLFVILITAAALVPALILEFGFSRVPYLIAEEGLTGMAAIRRSWELMRGHKWEYFVFRLSFLGWELLSALTMGVLGIFKVNPYVNISDGGYHRELVGGDEPVLMGEPAVDEYGNCQF